MGAWKDGGVEPVHDQRSNSRGTLRSLQHGRTHDLLDRVLQDWQVRQPLLPCWPPLSSSSFGRLPRVKALAFSWQLAQLFVEVVAGRVVLADWLSAPLSNAVLRVKITATKSCEFRFSCRPHRGAPLALSPIAAFCCVQWLHLTSRC